MRPMMQNHCDIIRRVFCAGWLIIIPCAIAGGKAKTKFTRQDAIDEYGGKDPFEDVKPVLSKPVFDKLNNQFNKYMESADDDKGTVKTGSQQILAVVGAVGKNAALLKGGDPLQIMSALMDISSAAFALVPGGQPFAIAFSIVSVALSFASQAKSESQKMQDFINDALWDSRATSRQNDVKTFLRQNNKVMMMLLQQIKDEEDGKHMITLAGIEDAMKKTISHYGSDEIESLWTIVENNIDLTKIDKTAANGLRVYNMIYLYVKAVILRDLTLTHFRMACEKATTRDCKGWKTRCRKMKRKAKDDMLSVYRNVITKMEYDRAKKYIKVGEYLERVFVNRSAVLIHHHPIGWSEQSRFIHRFVVKYALPSASSYQYSWVNQPKKKYMLQSAEDSAYHVEPEDQKIGNDVLELESDKCHIDYAIEFEKVKDPNNMERNGYFMMKQPRYENFLSGRWEKPALWRYYQHIRDFWLRLDNDDPPKAVYEKNSTKTANEYLFVVLEEEISDEARCSTGMKPKVVIVPKRVRYGNEVSGMFITWKNQWANGEPFESRLDGYPYHGTDSEFYLHDCQGKTSCPGCHSKRHIPESGKVDNRECPFSPL